MSHSPASRRREATLDRIAEAALALIVERGIDGLTMSALGERVDLTAAALYRYFPSKGALIAELVRVALESHRARLHASWRGVVDPADALRAAAQALVAHAREEPAAFGLIAVSIADPRHLIDDAAPAHLEAITGLLGELAAQIGAGQVAGRFSPGDPVARALRWLFALVGVLQTQKLARFDARLDPGPLALALAEDLLVAWSPSGGVR